MAIVMMPASLVSAQLAVLFATGLFLTVLLLSTAPTHVRRLTVGMTVAVVLAMGIIVPNIVIKCSEWIWCW